MCFGSGLHQWGFTIETFARIYAKKFGVDTEKMMKRLWGAISMLFCLCFSDSRDRRPGHGGVRLVASLHLAQYDLACAYEYQARQTFGAEDAGCAR